jgi:DNA-binding response OmpR family regulator
MTAAGDFPAGGMPQALSESFGRHSGVLDGGVHFIQKPFSVLDLTAKVREVLEALQRMFTHPI